MQGYIAKEICDILKSKMLKILDLFSGIGGFSIGLERAGMKTIAFCEIEIFCQKVLNKHWPQIPIISDIHKINYRDNILYESKKEIYKGAIDVICGGFPCQPFSVSGRKKGTQDDRDLWPQMFRVIQECKPTWVIGENVANFTNMAFTRTKINLESEGYQVQPLIVPACGIGAPHRRDRVWIIAYNTSKRTHGMLSQSLLREQSFSWYKDVRGVKDYFRRSDIPEPLICRESNGFSKRVDRLRSLGNSVVPQIPEIIGNAIMQVN